MIGECSWFRLEGDFLHLIPGKKRLHPIGEMFKLVDRKIGGSAAPEINKARFATSDKRHFRVNPQFLQGRLDIAANGGAVLVGIDLEVTKMTPFATKRN